MTRESAADSIVGQAVAPFDFSKVIEAAYADGVRIFVEAGPGSSCSRMIGKILQGREHVARSACVAGQEGVGICCGCWGSWRRRGGGGFGDAVCGGEGDEVAVEGGKMCCGADGGGGDLRCR